jgi:hypothetical protein
MNATNPDLEPLNVLVGEWKTTGTHPLMPGVTAHGRTVFEWIEGGAYLKMSSEVQDNDKFPNGTAIFGSDGDTGEIVMLYFDSRKVSRKYECSIAGNQWKWWRNSPNFSQRFTVTIEENGNKMVSTGEMRRGDSDWEGDLNLAYERVK